MTDARWEVIQPLLTPLEQEIIIWYGQAHVPELKSQSAVTKGELIEGFMIHTARSNPRPIEAAIDHLLSLDYLSWVDDCIFVNAIGYPGDD